MQLNQVNDTTGKSSSCRLLCALLRRRRDDSWRAQIGFFPGASSARSGTEMSLKAETQASETDLKGMLSSFEKKLDVDAEAKRQKAIEDAKPINEKVMKGLAEAKESAAQASSSRPKQVVATARPKKTSTKRSIGDGL